MRKIITAFMMMLCAVCMASAANYLTFTAEEDSSTFGIMNKGNYPSLLYSTDGGENWSFLAGSTPILAHKGDKALLKADCPNGFSANRDCYSTFTMTGKVAASGSVMSLVDGTGLSTEIPNNYCFQKLFSGCTSLTQAPELPATTLANYCYYEMFSGCTSLTQAPELPATTLSNYCYCEMFSGCTSLTQAPELPATTLRPYCYQSMFSGCTSLTQAPELSATTLAGYCYQSMFSGCTSLTQAPELSATTLTGYCYQSMFSGCTSLAKAPKLQSTTLAPCCYLDMFSGCTSLTQAPELPATTLAENCYVNMFSGCASLTQAPNLPATTLANRCYMSMFSGCTNLSRIHVSFDSWNGGAGTLDWVKDVAPAGTFICPDALPLECGKNRIPSGWKVKKIIDGDSVDVPVNYNYLTFTAEEDGSTFGIVNKKNNDPDVQYSLDGGKTWTALSGGDTVVLAHKGDKALLRGGNSQFFSKDQYQYSSFTMTGKVAASGSVMSLIDGIGLSTKIPCNYCFYSLFSGCAGLTQAPEMPATTLSNYCYWKMFFGCTSLTQASELPATTLTGNCYESMFSGCTSLTQAPALPATTLTEKCYYEMFSGCASLTQAPELPATTLIGNCYESMFSGCASLRQAPALPATTLTEKCYYRMFSGCASLTQAPALPATTLANYCYYEMFSGCTSLTQAPALSATTLAEWSCSGMFKNCAGLTQAPILLATTLAYYCYYEMFSGCTSLTQAPELPATTLAEYCYNRMFLGCASLTQAPELPATTLIKSCYEGMFKGCTSLTKAPKLQSTTLAIFCYRDMFSGCTSLTQAPALPATKLAESCYANMFSGCAKVSEIHVSFEDWGYYWATTGWLKDVAPTGTFICPKALPLEYGVDRIPEGWTVKYIDDTVAAETNYLTFTAEEDGSSFGIVNNEGNNPDVQYSLDGGKTWTALAAGDTITLAHKGDKALLRGDNPEGFSKDYEIYSSFTMTGKIAASGSVMSLIDGMGKTLVIPSLYCFYKLFSGCTSLTQAPELPATTLAGCCYQYMFKGCTSLTQAPALPAMTLADRCYQYMFEGCTSLTQAPALPATTLSEWCYGYMFKGCTSLTQAPELPATTLVSACYQYMFSGCTSLTQAPKLPAPELLANSNAKNSCYLGMFSGCTNLSEISVAFVEWKDSSDQEDNTYRWVENVAPTGTFICPKALPLEYGEDRIPEGWTVKYIEDLANYLTFTAEEDSSSFGIVNNGDNNPDVQYSLDGGATWIALSGGKMVTLAHKGDKALLKGNNPQGFSKNYDQYSSFKMTGKVAASGSVMSLIDGVGLSTEIPNSHCFFVLFEYCRGLTQAPELPATTLTELCYWYMFRSCTSLKQAPELPAMTLANKCYCLMFSGCTSLTQAPALPATTLAPYCYRNMFSGCKGLTQAPELPATTLAESCYYEMFEDCTSLTRAPHLPATTLADYCYMGMFSGCTSLSQISVSFDDWGENRGTYGWVSNVAPTGTFICPNALAQRYGEDRIPVGWTLEYNRIDPNYLTFTAEEDGSSFGIVNINNNNPDVQYSLDGGKTWTALAGGEMVTLAHKGDKALLKGNNPEGFSFSKLDNSSFRMTGKVAASGSVMSLIDGVGISTEVPGNFCFYKLFEGCTSLTQAPELPATILADNCYWGMFYHCTSLTQAPELPATTLAEGCYYEMFSGCTSLSEIKVPFDDWNHGDYTAEWVIDVAPTGTFICSKALPLEYGWAGIPEGWTVKYIEDMANYLTFTAEEDSSTFGIVNNAGNNPDLQYSLDGGKTWTALAGGDSVLLAHKGDKALLKGDNPQGFSKSFYQPTFKMTGKVAASGSVMSLICGTGLSTEILGNSCFVNLFKDCTSLTQAPELPATILTEYCYDGMFSGCTSLTQAPELPATTLDYVCYANMFEGCTSLTQAPKLPATTLLEGCYANMFSGCTSLSEINVSFEDWDYGMGTGRWVTNVAPTGTFICPKALALEYGENRIPEGWTVKYIDDTVAAEPNYLTFTAEEDGSTFGIVNNGDNNPDVQYSLDGGETWTALAAGDTITLAHKGDKALLRGNNPEGFSKDIKICSSFTMTGKIAASGSVMSLIDGTGLSTEIPNEYCFCRLFRACTSLTRAPELPATKLARGCYESMFSGCTSLTQAPELPATTLASCCYEFMFSGCTSLTQAPALPATTLAESCYDGMFSGCTSLSQAPELPATTLAPTCYCEMFSGCTSLTQAPELPATTLVEGCYYGMFKGCTSLTEAPELPATTLAGYCYSSMFKGCTSLTEAPELPATTLADYCYSSMFYGCTNLSQIDVAFEEWPINEGTYNYVANVAPTGTFICPKTLALEYGISRIPEGWTVKYIEDMPNYLTFTAEEDGSTFRIVNNGDNNPDVQYSLDGGETWTALAAGDTITLAHKGDKALLRGNNPEGFSKDGNQYSTFKMTGKVAASGSVMSLIDGTGLSTEIPGNYCFYSLFSGCTGLTQTPELPAMTLANYCYGYMFSGCTSLTQAPKLPATTLAVGCYSFMFSGCTSLTQAPELPATTLAEDCYSFMFSGCTGLTQAPKLPATTLADACYYEMFSGCTSLTQAPELPATNLAASCYWRMFSGCTSLTQAPELPATTLAEDCYSFMFSGCTGLAQAPELPATTLAYGCYNGIFVGCESLSQIRVSFDEWSYAFTGDWAVRVAPTGTFICPKDLPLEYGDSRIPEGWTVKYIEDTVAVEANYLTFTAEEDGSTFGIVNKDNNPDIQYSLDGGETWTALAAGDTITLAHKGDKALLKGNNPGGFSKYWEQYSTFKMTGKVAASGSVMSLIDGVGLSTEIPNGECFNSLFKDCASLTQAPELPATKLQWSCYESMFAGCTSLTQAPELPATNLAASCYWRMFSGCTSLLQAPELPATNLLEKSSYALMFSGCTSLSEINVSFEYWDYGMGTEEWVKDVAPTGTFICPKTLPLEYGESRIPEGWTVKYIEDGSGVNTTLADNISVWSDDLTIFVRGAEGEVSLYDMSGKRVAVSNSADEERALSVPSKGVYVVRTSGGERSVLVR